jgi:hypothetical protein
MWEVVYVRNADYEISPKQKPGVLSSGAPSAVEDGSNAAEGGSCPDR